MMKRILFSILAVAILLSPSVAFATIAFDASSQKLFTPTSWTHTPVGTPKGVIVSIGKQGSASDEISGVTYGGVAMTRVNMALSNSNLTEYFLGSGIPTGPQTVVVTYSAGPSGGAGGSAVTVTAAAGKDTQLAGIGSAVVNGASNPSVTITGISGASFGVSATVGSQNQTANQTLRESITLTPGFVKTETTASSSGNLVMSWTVTGGNDAMVGMAIEEVTAAVPRKIRGIGISR